VPGPRTISVVEKRWVENQEGHDEVMDLQRRSQEPILLYFHAPLSPYCKRFERDALSKPEVEEFLKDFLKVRIDSEEGKDLYRQYRITKQPVFMVRLSSGKLIPIHERSNPSFLIKEIEKAVIS